MREKLELKILALVVVLLLVGILAAGYMVLTIERSSLYSLTEASAESTAAVIVKDIERTMIEGRSDVTKALLHDLRGASGVADISVLNYEGRPAFLKNASPTDGAVLKQVTQKKAPVVIRENTNLTFYKPLENSSKCTSCHASEPAILGAVKISFSIEKQYSNATRLIVIVILATILASFCFSIVLWIAIRKMVILPIKALKDAAMKMSEGDLSFSVDIRTEDEFGKLTTGIRNSLITLSAILQRIRDVSKRVTRVAEEVEVEARKVVEGTTLETEAITNISSSVEEMNAVISDIAEGTDGLAASAEETAASMEQMVTSTTHITSSAEEMAISVESTSSSLEQLSATIREVANNTGELSAAAEETQSAIVQISTSIKEVEKRAKESALLSDRVRNDAVTYGMTSIEKAIKGMQDIQSSVEKTADYITKLGGRSEEIGQILNVIDEITDQTTMLALNAAILAAQAGEHGKGFSVVADEIKELADKTSTSTQEIAALIQAVQQEVMDAVAAMGEGLKSVETGFMVTNEAADALRKIVESSKKSSEMASAIERSTTEQTKAAQLVSRAMEKVLSMVGQISKATIEQSKGIQLIMKATEKVTDVSGHVKTATGEQFLTSKQISQAVELVSDKSQQIARAVNEQMVGSKQIWNSLEKIKDLPRETKGRAFRLSGLVRELMKDAELAVTEMEKFTFPEESTTGVLRLGIVPLESPAAMFKQFSPLAEYLGRALNRRVDLKVAVDFQGAVQDIGEGVTQFCFMTPSTYIEAQKKYGIKVIVKALRQGKPYQHSVIVTKEDSGINSLEDLRGHSFAFGDEHSTSSHIVPRAMLLSAGVDLKDLHYYNYLGHHDDVARSVLSGDFDAGGIMETTANKFRDKGLKQVKISEEIPEFNICATGSLDSRTVEEVAKALIALDYSVPERASILKSINASYTGFMEAKDDDYQNIRMMMSRIGLL